MSSLSVYALVSVGIGFFGLLTTPNYNPSFDFGVALILLGLNQRGINDREA